MRTQTFLTPNHTGRPKKTLAGYIAAQVAVVADILPCSKDDQMALRCYLQTTCLTEVQVDNATRPMRFGEETVDAFFKRQQKYLKERKVL